MAKLRTCKICNKQYEYCGHCPSKNLIEPWRNLYCSEECRDAFEIMGKYVSGKITAIEARKKLDDYGLSPNKVRDIHKAVVANIFRESEPKIEPQTEVEISSTLEVPSVDEPQSISLGNQKAFKKKIRKPFENKNDIVNKD